MVSLKGQGFGEGLRIAQKASFDGAAAVAGLRNVQDPNVFAGQLGAQIGRGVITPTELATDIGAKQAEIYEAGGGLATTAEGAKPYEYKGDEMFGWSNN